MLRGMKMSEGKREVIGGLGKRESKRRMYKDWRDARFLNLSCKVTLFNRSCSNVSIVLFRKLVRCNWMHRKKKKKREKNSETVYTRKEHFAIVSFESCTWNVNSFEKSFGLRRMVRITRPTKATRFPRTIYSKIVRFDCKLSFAFNLYFACVWLVHWRIIIFP